MEKLTKEQVKKLSFEEMLVYVPKVVESGNGYDKMVIYLVCDKNFTDEQIEILQDLSNVNCVNCVGCWFCVDCVDCEDCFFCKDCVGCWFCVDCEGCDNCENCVRCLDCKDRKGWKLNSIN